MYEEFNQQKYELEKKEAERNGWTGVIWYNGALCGYPPPRPWHSYPLLTCVHIEPKGHQLELFPDLAIQHRLFDSVVQSCRYSRSLTIDWIERLNLKFPGWEDRLNGVRRNFGLFH